MKLDGRYSSFESIVIMFLIVKSRGRVYGESNSSLPRLVDVTHGPAAARTVFRSKTFTTLCVTI